MNAARVRVSVSGAVQGVGFRPWVYRMATDLGLHGWITNDANGVVVEAEGELLELQRFLSGLRTAVPPRAVVREVRGEWLDPVGYTTFEIRHSREGGSPTALVLPDLTPCAACLTEMRDPADRRFGYPFMNCTDCGPRFTIVRALPYDRARTTMASFTMCPACAAEYEDPRDRRFHAQPNACAECGPHASLRDAAGRPVPRITDDALAVRATCALLRTGAVVAMKGVGGFLLLCAAENDDAIRALRARKRRPTKPFAVMVDSMDRVRTLSDVDPEEIDALNGPDSPIVLLRARGDAPVSRLVAPGNPYLGVMLPSSPLHHLIAGTYGRPLVATSGNRSDEPICTDEREAIDRLRGIADYFLVHDRPIERHADDSIVVRMDGAMRPLRRARGQAPLPVTLAAQVPALIAVGAHMKNVIALARGSDVFLSQHIGDLETPEALAAFERVILDFLRFHDARPVAIAHDLHPGLASTQWAQRAASSPPFDGDAPARLVPVQHHHAHLAACLADNDVDEPALGLIWDGTGYGTDGTVWGGEFLLGGAASFSRMAHLRPFALPGGEAAVREPRRTALALLHSIGEADAVAARFGADELSTLLRMLETGTRTPVTTSMGRLFDGFSALLGLCDRAGFEGEAAMALEFATDAAEPGAYPFPLRDGIIDWEDALRSCLHDIAGGTPASACAARFHNGLVDAALTVARAAGCPRVALSGGCFQNRLLTERMAARLRANGFDVLLHRRVPPNDGGIAFGQVAVAAAALA